MATPTRWAVLLCRYKDDTNDPTKTTIKQLAAQNATAPWVMSAWNNNTNTILEEYTQFFTSTGSSTNNMPNFFDAVSHGSVSLGAEIFPCQLDRTLAEATKLATVTEPGSKFQDDNFKLAKKAWKDQWNSDQSQFYATIVSFQNPDFGSQGGMYDGGPGVYMDIRYVLNNGSKRWGHEMGHAFGLDHSRADTNDPTFNPAGCQSPGPDYRDPWDTMSAECSFGFSDPDYTASGPGLNAWNMRSRGWLDESRVWHCPQDVFSQVVTLRPLQRLDLAGFLAAELPPLKANSGFPRYLVEFRQQAGWDAGIPRSCVQVHRLDGSVKKFEGVHSYIEFSIAGNPDMIVGDIFAPGAQGAAPKPVARVLSIDEPNQAAVIRLSYLPSFIAVCVGSNEDGRIEIFCIDESAAVRHLWQTAPNNGWTQEFPRIGPNDLGQSITMIQDSQQQLEVFYVGTDNHLYQNWQTMKNGNWHGEKRISDNTYARQIAAALNDDGTLQIFYRGLNDSLYYNVEKSLGKWAGEKKLGDAVSKVQAARNQDGTLEVCLIGAGGNLFRRRQQGKNKVDSWGVLTSLATIALDFSLVQCPDGVLEMILIDAGGHLRHMVQNGVNGDWQDQGTIQGFARTFAVCVNSVGLLEMFFTDASDVIHHCSQTHLHVWNRASDVFVAAAKRLFLIKNEDGHLELIYIGTDNQLYHNWQLGATSGWAGEMPF